MPVEKRFLAILLALSFLVAAAGINWDQPSAGRTNRILSPQWPRQKFFDRLSGSWRNIYKVSETETPLLAEAALKYSTRLKSAIKVPPGGYPPETLDNFYRSMMVRSRYPDEANQLTSLAQMKPAELKLRPPSFIYGGGYLYPLGAYLLALSKTGIIKRLSMRQSLDDADNLGRIFIAGRFLSVFAFAGIALMGFLIALQLSGDSAASFFSMGAVMTAPILIIHAHYLTPHLWSAFWSLASVYFMLRCRKNLDTPCMLLSGFCLGFSTGAYWAQAQTVLFLAAILLSGGAELTKKGNISKIAAMAGLAVAVFFALNPYLLTEMNTALKEMAISAGKPQPWQPANVLNLAFKTLPKTVGPALTAVIGGGGLLCLMGENRVLKGLAAASAVIFFLASFTLPEDFQAGIRRFFPCLAISLVAGSVAVYGVIARLRGLPAAACVCALLLPGTLISAVYGLNFIRASSTGSTFSLMADRLDSLPTGKSLGILGIPQPAEIPHFALYGRPLEFLTDEELAGRRTAGLPEYFLLAESHKTRMEKQLRAAFNDKYALLYGFYPKKVLGIRPYTTVSAVNSAIELYRRADIAGP